MLAVFLSVSLQPKRTCTPIVTTRLILLNLAGSSTTSRLFGSLAAGSGPTICLFSDPPARGGLVGGGWWKR